MKIFKVLQRIDFTCTLKLGKQDAGNSLFGNINPLLNFHIDIEFPPNENWVRHQTYFAFKKSMITEFSIFLVTSVTFLLGKIVTIGRWIVL